MSPWHNDVPPVHQYIIPKNVLWVLPYHFVMSDQICRGWATFFIFYASSGNLLSLSDLSNRRGLKCSESSDIKGYASNFAEFLVAIATDQVMAGKWRHRSADGGKRIAPSNGSTWRHPGKNDVITKKTNKSRVRREEQVCFGRDKKKRGWRTNKWVLNYKCTRN